MAHDLKYGEATFEKDSTHNPLNGSDEPVFVIRASDRLGFPMVARYGSMAAGVDGQSAEFLAGVDDVLAAFDKWRVEHPDAMKLPD